MEISALLGMGLCLWVGGLRSPHAALIGAIYGGHYVYRSLIYPLLSPSSAAPASVLVVALAFVFNVFNSSIYDTMLELNNLKLPANGRAAPWAAQVEAAPNPESPQLGTATPRRR